MDSCSGYCTAEISGILHLLETEWKLDSNLQSLVVTSLLFGAVPGAAVSGLLADNFGRRETIKTTAAIFALGSFVSALAPNPPLLIAGRFITGAGVGAASLCVPLYISEISPPGQRGAIVSVNQLAIVVGILFAYLANAVFIPHVGGWRTVLMIGAGPAVMLGLGMLFAPESPRWMLTQKVEQEARRIFNELGTPDVDHTVLKTNKLLASGKGTSFSELFQPGFRPALIAGLGILVIQQFAGINAIVYSAPYIFRTAGVGDDAVALFATVGLGVTNVLMTLVSICLLDRVGRKPLLSLSLIGMILSMVCLGTIWHRPEQVSSTHTVLVIGFVVLYIASFAVGLGTVGWLLISEIFPLRIRGVSMAVPATAHWICNIVVCFIFQREKSSLIDLDKLFFIFAAVGVLGWFFLRRFAPETKGLALEDIENHWNKRKSVNDINR